VAITAAVEDHLDAAEHRQQVLASVLPDNLPTVVGVERLIREALANYLSNAVKYTQPGGRISVGARQLGAKVRIEVTDDGPGISPADQARLFQEFARVGKEEGRRGRTGGLGLGLSIVRRIADAHRGRAGVESQPGHGSTFYLELPVR
jgi:signal transduction histidine kinase